MSDNPVPMYDEPRPYNSGYTHETLHAVSMTQDLFDRWVLESECGGQYPDVKEAAEKIARALGDLYQLIGTKADAEDNAAEP